MPTMMKPMTGEILRRAKAGMTIPAAPRIVSVSLRPCPPNSLAMARYRQGARTLSPRQAETRSDVMAADLDLIIVGGGPAGVMAGLLFARAGCRVRVLEKHADFFRDFRGDTVHPSTMDILDQLGYLQRFLKRPHNKVSQATLRLAGRDWTIGDLSHLKT